jgi:proline dehydrogenase|tara:strand:- start:262 stop:1434 length:1173 start_codon:yes stop_codon:yes gene_type:complete
MQNKIFNNTEIAFKNKSFLDLLRAYLIFKIISFPVLVTIGKYVLLLLLKAKFPIKFLIKISIFKQFCGGENEDECKKTIDNLRSSDIYSILDYSVEGLVSNESFDNTVLRTLNLIKLNTSNNFPFIVFKPTAIGEFKLYEKVSLNKKLSNKEAIEWGSVINRFNLICESALKNNVSVLIDAEESWIQASVDEIFENLIVKYNSERTTVYNTVQAYRVDRLNYIKYLQNKFESKKVSIGIKLVRGAYMEKERERSYKLNYASPIHNSKNETDVCFNDCMNYMFEHINLFSIFIGTHNEESNALAIKNIKNHNVNINDGKVWFSQLYGMSDNISYNLSFNGYRVAKYLPFGPVKDVIPYLLRRADENTSIEGQTSRELLLFKKELKRRKSLL